MSQNKMLMMNGNVSKFRLGGWSVIHRLLSFSLSVVCWEVCLFSVCPSNMEPVQCVNPCPDKCHYLDNDDVCYATRQCVPGCACPGDKVLGENGECVEPMDCACLDEEGNVHDVSSEATFYIAVLIWIVLHCNFNFEPRCVKIRKFVDSYTI